MKTPVFFALLCPFAVAIFAQNQPVELKDSKSKASYGIGLSIGVNLKRQGADLNTDALAAGLRDGLSSAKPQVGEQDLRQAMNDLQQTMQQKQQAEEKKRQEMAPKNKEDGEKFLAQNKSKPGVKTTASGLQYKVEKEGKGTSPKPSDMVTVNYRGTLIDGTEFDSSYKRGEPATFPVNGVIKGWTEALQLMKPGAKYQLFIPSNLAYGDRGAGPDIGPNSTLVFDVELIDVKSGGGPGPSPSAAAN